MRDFRIQPSAKTVHRLILLAAAAVLPAGHAYDDETEMTYASAVPLNEEGYQAIAVLHNTAEMSTFAKRVSKELGLEVVDDGMLNGISRYHSGEEAVQSFDRLKEEMRVGVETGFAKPIGEPADGQSLSEVVDDSVLDDTFERRDDSRPVEEEMAEAEYATAEEGKDIVEATAEEEYEALQDGSYSGMLGEGEEDEDGFFEDPDDSIFGEDGDNAYTAEELDDLAYNAYMMSDAVGLSEHVLNKTASARETIDGATGQELQTASDQIAETALQGLHALTDSEAKALLDSNEVLKSIGGTGYRVSSAVEQLVNEALHNEGLVNGRGHGRDDARDSANASASASASASAGTGASARAGAGASRSASRSAGASASAKENRTEAATPRAAAKPKADAPTVPSMPSELLPGPHVQIMGLFDTGTNYLRSLLEKNFGGKITVYDMYAPHAHYWKYSNLPQCFDIKQNSTKGKVCSFWKHANLEVIQARSPARLRQMRDLNVVGVAVIRDPLSWLQSIRAAPYDFNHPPNDVTGDDWLTRSYTTTPSYYGGGDTVHYSSLSQVWNNYTTNYDHLDKFGFKSSIVLRYEDLVLKTEELMQEVANLLNITAPLELKQVDEAAKSGVSVGHTEAIKKIQTKSFLLKYAPQEMLDACNRLDSAMMDKHGYTSCPKATSSPPATSSKFLAPGKKSSNASKAEGSARKAPNSTKVQAGDKPPSAEPVPSLRRSTTPPKSERKDQDQQSAPAQPQPKSKSQPQQQSTRQKSEHAQKESQPGQKNAAKGQPNESRRPRTTRKRAGRPEK